MCTALGFFAPQPFRSTRLRDLVKIKGANGLIFEVPDSVASGLIGSGAAERVVEEKAKPKRQPRKGAEPQEA